MIICSVGKGTMPESECLACALRGENTCGYDYGLLKNMFNYEDRAGIHVTDLTGCLLQSYWRKVQPEPIHVHKKLVLYLGTIAHSLFESNDERQDSEVVLEADGVVGRADVITKDGYIIDYKTTRWLKPTNLPYGSHETQLNIYAHLARKMGMDIKGLLIQYVDMSGPTKCKKRSCNAVYEWDQSIGALACPVCGESKEDAHTGAVLFPIPLWDRMEVESYVNRRRDALVDALDQREPPVGEPSWLCNYCEFKYKCRFAE